MQSNDLGVLLYGKWEAIYSQNYFGCLYYMFISWTAKRLRNYCIEAVSVCVSYMYVSVCPFAMTLKWHSIVNSQYITIQLYRRVDNLLRYVAIEIWHSQKTRTTAFAAKRLSVSPTFKKCNIPISNCPIALRFDTEVKYLTLHTKYCQCLDKHTNRICDNTFCIPQFLEMQYLHE